MNLFIFVYPLIQLISINQVNQLNQRSILSQITALITDVFIDN